VVSVGGGANIPAVTTMLSGRFRVPVVTTPRPKLTAAIGAALRAARGPGDATPTRMTPAVPATALAPIPVAPGIEDSVAAETALPDKASALMPAMAWSEAEQSRANTKSSRWRSGYTSARPALKFQHKARPAAEKEPTVLPWHRVPGVVLIGTAVAILLVGMALAIALNSDDKQQAPAPSPSPATSAPAPPPAPSAAPQGAPVGEAPTEQVPPPADTPLPAAPEPAPQVAPAPPAPAVQPRVPRIPAIPAIPHIPGISAPILGIPGLGSHGH
jgi:hypothetical protein